MKWITDNNKKKFTFGYLLVLGFVFACVPDYYFWSVQELGFLEIAIVITSKLIGLCFLYFYTEKSKVNNGLMIIESPKLVFMTSIIGLFIGGGLLFLSRFAFINPSLICFTGCLILVSAKQNYMEGLSIVTMWKNISKLEVLSIDIDKLPKKDGQQYMGHGAVWEKEECQASLAFTKFNSEDIRAKNSKLGGNSLLHGLVMHKEEPIFLPHALLTQHMIIFGTTGCGKTRFLEYQISQAIEREEGCLFIDPKGDETLLNRAVEELKKRGRFDKFKLFALPYPDKSCKYDPLKNYTRPEEIADRLAPLMGTGGGSGEQFIKYCWDVLNIVVQVMDKYDVPINLKSLRRYCVEDTNSLVVDIFIKKKIAPMSMLQGDDQIILALEQYIEKCRNRDYDKYCDETIALAHLAKRPKENHQKMTNSLKPLLNKFSTGGVGSLLSPGPTDENVLDWNNLVQKGEFCYFFLGSLQGEESAVNCAKIAMMDLMSYVGSTYAYEEKVNYKRLNIFIDELSMVVMPQLNNILNQARGAGVSVCGATQAGISDLEEKMPSRASAIKTIANCNIHVQMLDQAGDAAELFSDNSGTRSIVKATHSTNITPGVRDSGQKNIGTVSVTKGLQLKEEEEPLVSKNNVMQLPVGQAYARWQGRVYKLRFPYFQDPKENYLVEIGVKSRIV